jgi:hypothetical protein
VRPTISRRATSLIHSGLDETAATVILFPFPLGACLATGGDEAVGLLQQHIMVATDRYERPTTAGSTFINQKR